jgi:hypothetical protein
MALMDLIYNPLVLLSPFLVQRVTGFNIIIISNLHFWMFSVLLLLFPTP